MAYLPTLDDLIQDLQLAKEIAIKNENVNGLINSVMSQAKLLGYDQPQPANEPSEVSLLSDLIDELSSEVNNDKADY
ncbi:hypothetical protein [Psychrobacter sp. UBA3962]|uniref:hypothetical protein n=1 Tax=Psychrobacter sp. UBA3962 TaxID=1947352 RepID=UPI00260120E1|nr:hypothetical protein [Psychrobacter sp. UBA3962]